MLQKVVGFLRALDSNADIRPETPRAWLLWGAALVIRWLTWVVLWPWRKLTEPRFAIMRPYINPRHPARIIARIVFPIALGIICVAYGFMFGLTAPYLLVPFAVPIVILVLLAIWALPETHNAPTTSMEAFYAGVLISLLVWPNYLALSLPGLPWITALRLTSFPLALLFLISLSSSSVFRGELAETLRAPPGFWFAASSFLAIQFITIPLSKDPAASLNTAALAQVNWTTMFLVGMWVARKPGRVERYATLFIMLSLPMAIVAIFENMMKHPLWLNHVPPFLKIDDALAAKYMQVILRGDMYRAKSIYASPLSFAECLALFTPFCIHFAMQKYSVWFRVLCALLIPTFFLCIRMTDARLGILGMMASFLAYYLLWALLQLGRNARSLMAAAVVYAYPAAFGFAIMAVMFVHKVRVLVLGGGEAASSNDARQEQINLGVPKIFGQPWGHGAGTAAETLGFSPGGFTTIDNYYLSIGLDYGVLGFLAFYGMFVLAIAAAVRTILKSPAALDTREKTLLLPLAVSATVFVIIRGVLSQDDNHALAFSMLGFLVGMVYRVRKTAKEQQDLLDAERAALAAAPRNRATPRMRALTMRSATTEPGR
ncbi:MAG: hypothetical protein EPO51_16130 [Phenylobacterium sp.]|uniref:O-antigen ligase family protein n=1 Tax=Phenylobacterium sp. TaxID=1871053 RepID=UPI001218B56F|nr:O-antigen ligase family protein [Phenylobacterium sp.]TAJ70624.1 MAG: hypothetical protein EPO51_16130 [Phenylobacterium sp.]